LRADNQRMAERAQKLESQIPAAAPVAAAPAPRPNVERAALAAIAAAVAEVPQAAAPQTYGDVTVRPIAQKPTLFPEPEQAPLA
ncbi:cell division protein FtsZ, partial [Pseudomonas sp. MPR-E5]